MILRRIHVCTNDEVRLITAQPDFIRVLLHNTYIPADELVPTAIRRAANLHDVSKRSDFLMACGNFLAKTMAREPVRLENILRLLGDLYKENDTNSIDNKPNNY